MYEKITNVKLSCVQCLK